MDRFLHWGFARMMWTQKDCPGMHRPPAAVMDIYHTVPALSQQRGGFQRRQPSNQHRQLSLHSAHTQPPLSTGTKVPMLHEGDGEGPVSMGESGPTTGR